MDRHSLLERDRELVLVVKSIHIAIFHLEVVGTCCHLNVNSTFYNIRN